LRLSRQLPAEAFGAGNDLDYDCRLQMPREAEHTMCINRRAAMALGATSVFAAAARPAIADDQTRILQARIDAAQAGNGELALEAGVYPVASLNVTAPIVITGMPGKTILQGLTSGPILSVNTTTNVTISGVVFDSTAIAPTTTENLETTYQLLAYQCTDILVEKCIFRNAKTSGAGFDACTGRVLGNQFHEVGQIALRVGRFFGGYTPDKSRGMEISGNHLHDLGNGGIYVFHNGETSDEDGTIVTNNHIETVASGSGNGQYGNAIDVYNANNVIVANNRIAGCDYSGVRVVSSKHCQVIGNNISRTADCAIFVEFAFESVVVSNNVVEDVNLGIQLSGGGNVQGYVAVCANNIVRNVNRVGTNPQASNFIGIDIASVATNCIGNVVENVGANEHGPGIGILVIDWSASHFHQVQSNIIKDAACGIGLVLGEGAAKVNVSGNTIIAATAANITELEQVTYGDGSVNTLTPTGSDLARGKSGKERVLLANNITLP
jgi:uncharacterized secreted repeat protein (TIGR03808 family)